MEQVTLRHLLLDVMHTYTYSGNLFVENLEQRLYNDSGQDRKISFVRASVGTPSKGGMIEIDVKKNGNSIFIDTPIHAEYPNARPKIKENEHTGVGTPVASTVWEKGSYLTVGITRVGSTFGGADLTINVVVSE